jgi:GxxExxY protein
MTQSLKRGGREERGDLDTNSLNDLSHAVIGAAIEVHRDLGPGLLESAYEGAFSHELTLRAIPHVRQKILPVVYKGSDIEVGYRIDLLVGNRLVVELKALEKLLSLHSTQLLTYLRLGNYPLGLLINFNVRRLVEGIERISNAAPNLSALSASSALKPRCLGHSNAPTPSRPPR